MMTVHEITSERDRARWNAIVAQYADPGSGFLQSWEWGLAQEQYGRRISRFLLSEHNEDIGVVLLLQMSLPGNALFLFSPGGPVVRDTAFIAQLPKTEAFQNLAFTTKSIHWRLEPRHTWNASSPFRRVRDVEPSATLILDIRPDAAILLEQMKQKTRYNIRLAEKKGVRVSFVTRNDHPDWRAFSAQWWTLSQETNVRHRLRSHPQAYYENMIATLGPIGMLEIAQAHHENELLAMNLLIRFKKTITYLHGASTRHKKELMAPYALQWASIQRAKEYGMETYDFFGVSPDGARDHPLAAVTRFKMGFGGTVARFPGTFEFPVRPLSYTIYKYAKRIKTMLRS